MDQFTRTDMDSLVEKRNELSVSILMPTEKTAPANRQNPIRFKNQLQLAEEQLMKSGMKETDVTTLFKRAHDLMNGDFDFWQYASDGLAFYLSPTRMKAYRLPLKFKDVLMISGSFYLKPLFPLITYNGQFYILALSKNQARVLEATRLSVNEVNPAHMPKSLADVLKYYEWQDEVQFHTRTAQNLRQGGRRNAMFYGQGGGAEEIDEHMGDYLTAVDKGVTDFLGDKRAPLVLATIEDLQGAYQEINHYRHLLGKCVRGNPDRLTAEQLHEEAWKIVAPHFHKPLDEARNLYGNAAGHGNTSINLTEIIPAAATGRIGELLVNVDGQVWGEYEHATFQAEVHNQPEPGDEELTNFAAVQTYLTSGRVHAVEPTAVPGEAHMAAILRY